MFVGLLRLEARLLSCHSLKDKRQIVRSAIDRFHASYRLSVSEVDDHDDKHYVSLGIAFVASARETAERLIEELVNSFEESADCEIAEVERIVEEFRTLLSGQTE